MQSPFLRRINFGFMRQSLNFLCCVAVVAFTDSLSTALPADERAGLEPFFADYCYKCHDGEVQKGDLRLDTAMDHFDMIGDRELWLSVLEQIETQEMPPKKPLPSAVEYEEILVLLEEQVNDIDWEALKHPGHVTLPRLTQVEYDNTIRDLLGLDLKTGRFFSPDAEGRTGFTNDRDNLFVTGGDLEKYLGAAEMAVEALHSFREEPTRRRLEAEDMIITESRTRTVTFADESVGHNLSRGQLTLYESIDVPVYGFYRFTVRARSSKFGPAGGLIRVDDALVGEIEVVGQEMAEDSIEAFLMPGTHQLAVNVKPVPRERRGAKKEEPVYTVLPENANELVGIASREHFPQIELDAGGDAEIAAKIARWNRNQGNVQRPYEWLRLLGENGSPTELRNFLGFIEDRSEILIELRGEITEALGISVAEFDSIVKAQNPQKMADREHYYELAQRQQPRERGFLGMDWIEIEGPIMPEERSVPALAKEASAAVVSGENWEPWFEDFIARAFRCPVEGEESATYLSLYKDLVKGGESHAAAASQTVAAVLVSPRFLYRSEELPREEEGEVVELDGYQLASRLSYFLWQTMPDEALRKSAENGDLPTPKGLKEQVRRILADDKALAFYDTFPGQWLGYEALGSSVVPDGTLFPEFDTEFAESMKEETRRLFQSVFQENRSVIDLIAAEETYLNHRLATHYGLPEVRGDGFVRVDLTDEQRRERGGLLGMASVLTATSTPVRTSPVLRGVFVMERLLGDEPGEPPADAGELPGNAGARGKSLREELAIHRDKADCAICHDKIDPLGFGLEGFDALGRVKEGKEMPKDTKGTLPDGSTFEGVDGLREYLAEHRGDDFSAALVEKLLAYALGRELQIYDEPVVKEILEKTGPDGYRGRALVEAIVLSYPFTHQHRSPDLILPPIAAKP